MFTHERRAGVFGEAARRRGGSKMTGWEPPHPQFDMRGEPREGERPDCAPLKRRAEVFGAARSALPCPREEGIGSRTIP
jgi:hypothetical protein